VGGRCAAYGKKINACGILMGKPEGKRSLERPECRWEDTIGKV
jgi:hypothetical protein